MQLRIIRRAGPAALAFALALTAAPAAPVPSPRDDKKPAEAPAEKIRKALDQEIANLEIENQQLNLAIEQLHEETKINFVLDRTTIAQMGIDVDSATVKAKLQKVKARTALRNILNQYGLSYAIVGESVLITTEEMAVYRQLKQRVSIDIDRVEMAKALKGLARETATNLLVDTRAQKDAQTAVTLQLDDVPLETAVRLIAESAGLKPVRLGNVVLVTTKAHATELRNEPDLVPSPRVPGADMPVPPGVAVPGGGVVPLPAPAAPAAPNPPEKPADPPKLLTR
ncbi:MAG TPA: hypothetical protein VKA46_02735 [Gemmataceae bacterium]|nr:hypothetical protein [Gemmataceae bacterium]